MKVRDVLDCALPSWYHQFAKVTFKSIIIPLPSEVLEYLRSSGTLVLPSECDQDFNWAEDSDWDQEDEEPSGIKAGEEDPDELEKPTFPEFSTDVQAAMETLGGQAFCKLNWSSPRDATWITCGNSLKCTKLSDIYLLLKSSEFARHDLRQPFKDCEDGDLVQPNVDYVLILRKWTDINPGHEFRCFVKNKSLFAVSQRDGMTFYKHLANDRSSILRDIRTFFDEHIKERFPLQDYVFDVMRSAKDTVKLIDFNPFGETTDGLLFDWEELRSNQPCDGTFESSGVSFRYVENDSGIQPNNLRQYSLPKDIVDLTNGTDHEKLVDLLKLQHMQQQREDDD